MLVTDFLHLSFEPCIIFQRVFNLRLLHLIVITIQLNGGFILSLAVQHSFQNFNIVTKLYNFLPKLTVFWLNDAFCETRSVLLLQKSSMIFWDQSFKTTFHYGPGDWETLISSMLADSDAFITFMKIRFPVVSYLTTLFLRTNEPSVRYKQNKTQITSTLQFWDIINKEFIHQSHHLIINRLLHLIVITIQLNGGFILSLAVQHSFQNFNIVTKLYNLSPNKQFPPPPRK